jgi:hypothetical protein
LASILETAAVRLKRLYSKLISDNQIAIDAAECNKLSGENPQNTRVAVGAVQSTDSTPMTKSIAGFPFGFSDL